MKKRTASKRPRRQRLPKVDEGLIIDMLRLTPTERLQRGFQYAEWAKELLEKFHLKEEQVCLFRQVDRYRKKFGLA